MQPRPRPLRRPPRRRRPRRPPRTRRSRRGWTKRGPTGRRNGKRAAALAALLWNHSASVLCCEWVFLLSLPSFPLSLPLSMRSGILINLVDVGVQRETHHTARSLSVRQNSERTEAQSLLPHRWARSILSGGTPIVARFSGPYVPRSPGVINCWWRAHSGQIDCLLHERYSRSFHASMSERP